MPEPSDRQPTRAEVSDEDARAQLERATEHLHLALAAGKMGTWEWRVPTGEVIWSPMLEAIHGLPEGSFDGSFEAYQRDIHPEDRDRVSEAIQATLAGGSHHLEYRIVLPDGSIRWVEAHGHLVRDPTGRPLRLVGVCTDVTERKLAEIERARMSEELQRVADFRRRLLGIVAHDLRNPLGAITMSADVLGAHDLPERAQGIVARIRRSADRMGRMISDLMDYSQGQAGGIPITPQDVNMEDIGRRAIEELEASMPEHRVVLAVEGDTHGRWDPDRVAQVFGNLVSNALQHGTGEVNVRLCGEPDSVTLRVSNGGDPIPSDLLPRLTQPFARGATHGQGLGLGVYIVHEIVSAHGGTLRIESEATSGTHFSVAFPRIVRTAAR